ncbi:9551_t:CDS:2, partial [Scutellospora calospora]
VTLVAQRNFTTKSSYYSSIPQILFDNKDTNEYEILLKESFLSTEYLEPIRLAYKLAISSYVSLYNFYKKTDEEINIDLFFCDFFANDPCFDLAWKLGKPVVGFSSNIYPFSFTPYKSDPLFGCPVNMEIESFYNRFKCVLISPLQSIGIMIAYINDLNVQRAKVGIEPNWDLKSRTSNILMLYHNFFGFEIPSAESPLHQHIGPILPEEYPSLTPALNLFLANNPRTIYFAIGTFGTLSPQNIFTLLKSFLELINQGIIDGVIWATVLTNTKELLSLTESDITLSTILNNNNPHIHLIEYAPQVAILSHKNTKLFLSHGGASSSHESMYYAKPMLILPVLGDQLGNAEKLELAGIALKVSKDNLDVNDIISKVKRLLNEESFKKNAKRLQFLAKVNSKRKYRAADLIEVVLNTAMHEGFKDENGTFKIDNKILLRDWITPSSRMGFIRGNYLDVYGVAIMLFLTLIGGFGYTLFKITKFFYTKCINGNSNSHESLKPKVE